MFPTKAGFDGQIGLLLLFLALTTSPSSSFTLVYSSLSIPSATMPQDHLINALGRLDHKDVEAS